MGQEVTDATGRPELSVYEHYEVLAAAFADPAQGRIVDPFHDPPGVAAWLSQADGPEFWQAVGPVTGESVLEVGIGTGRVAHKMLQHGCAHLTGLDVSPKTLALARENLANDLRIELLQCDVGQFVRPAAYDLAYSVWTFFHIGDKPGALRNMLASLQPGGRLVLSLERTEEWLDFGTHLVRQYPVPPEQYVQWLREAGCEVGPPVPVPDRESPTGELLTTIVSARKP